MQSVNTQQRKPILLTPGEPAGIGPDLAIELAQHPQAPPIIAIADPQLLEERAALLERPLRLRMLSAEQLKNGDLPPAAAGQLLCLPIPLAEPASPGRINPANAAYVLQTLDLAVDCCLQQWAHAMVTGPVHKAAINAAGIAFNGHTEYLAQRCGSAEPLMLLATHGLRVALATTHLPLSAVPGQITAARLDPLLRLLHSGLRTQFGIEHPHILVAGLNPHAGEEGVLGREEIEIIAPVVASLRAEGMRLSGPLPADTLFTRERLATADAVFAMYHDQGLPVLKHLGFGEAVNITLGLPIVRTSVDHGTALELAGSGRADMGSLLYAVATAAAMQPARLAAA